MTSHRVRLYMGTHRPHWLATSDVPLFVCRKTLEPYKNLPRAVVPWVLDSGGFSELSAGAWHLRTRDAYPVTISEYAREVLRYQEEIGMMEWAAPLDWMCEPEVVWKHDLGVLEHQRRTIENFLRLRDLCGPIVAPVVQGWTLDDYLRHLDMYQQAGVYLTYEPIVAVGSVCRRSDDDEIVKILDRLAREGLTLHAFGVRSSALERIADALTSADSLVWSYSARREAQDPNWEADHTHPRGGRTCANCFTYARRWYDAQLDRLDPGRLEVYAA
jgi:hypothetical protein